MKKTLLFLTFSLICFLGFSQFSEDFESGTFPPAGWMIFDNGIGTVESWTEAGTTNHYAKIKYENVASGTAEDWLVTSQFTVDAAYPILGFDNADYFTSDYGSIYTVRVSTASQNTASDFTVVDTQTEADLTHQTFSKHYVDLSAYIGQQVYIAFVMANDDGDYWFIDNILMEANLTAPNPVVLLTPQDGATDVAIDTADNNADGNPDMAVAFDWDPPATGDPATSYEIYLGDAANNMTLLGETASDNVTITGMTYSTTYYWSIVAKNNGGTATNSPVWSFTTEADPTANVASNEIVDFKYFYAGNALTVKSNSSVFNSISIVDITGKTILSKNLHSSNETISMSNVSEGLYIAKVTTQDNKVKTFKFIVR